MATDEKLRDEGGERGRRASFDPVSGAVHGSGSGAGGLGNADEDYDNDAAAGSGEEPVTAARTEEGEARARDAVEQGERK